jgi:ubiquinone/menaquinone biosynthesis C-methylase UbiE
MSSDSSWKTFFASHAAIYDDNVFTKNTLREVDFLLEELHVPPGARILDVGCGTGRHSIELAKRGYRMTGLDLSDAMLAQARAKAEAAGVHVEWVQSDAMRFSFDEPFDAAICLCEGSFGLLASVDDAIAQPLAILANISRSLKPGARILLTALNAMWMIRMHKQEDVEQGGFDPLTLSRTSDVVPVEGQPPVRATERGFVPTELVLLFRLAGLTVQNIWGGTAGNWGHRKIDLDEIEIMVVARKSAEPHMLATASF